nr:MopE-related protein [Acidobacteriota bacterium]
MSGFARTAREELSRHRFAFSLLVSLVLVAAAAITPAAGQACPDADLDGYADCTVPGCNPSGLLCGDCDDGRNDVRPGLAETCDQVDNDCDGYADEGFAVVSSSVEFGDPGAAGSDAFGSSIAAIGDVDGDGIDDIVVGVPEDDPANVTNAGSAALFSGDDRRLICRAVDPEGANSDDLGWSVSAIGDLNHDGIPDFAVGAIYDDTAQGSNAGSVVVFSGADCSRLVKLTDNGGATSDYLGSAVAGAGDVNGDGTPDVAAGAPYDDTAGGTNAGSVVLFSGANGSVILKLADPLGANADLLGGAIAAVGDLNHDGTADIAAGAEGREAGGTDRGGVLVFSGADGSVLLRLTDPQSVNYEHLGASIAPIGDLDHDGTDDLVVGAPENNAQASSAGRLVVFSGGSGAVLLRLTDPAGVAGDRLGRSVSELGDMNGDGTVDVAAGAPYADSAGTDAGAILLFSGADGSVIAKMSPAGGAAGYQTGTALAAAFDLTGDGEVDLVAGAPYAPTAEGSNVGRVVIFARESDCDGDGFTPLTGDCRDDGGAGSSNVRPDASETCNAVDDDCDGWVDEDDDADGYAACAGDCDNADPRVFPGAPERCNAADDDCDGSSDEGSDGDGD